MRFMLLIHQGAATTPRSPEEWKQSSEEEQQAVYADYKAINENRAWHQGSNWTSPRRRSPCGSRMARP